MSVWLSVRSVWMLRSWQSDCGMEKLSKRTHLERPLRWRGILRKQGVPSRVTPHSPSPRKRQTWYQPNCRHTWVDCKSANLWKYYHETLFMLHRLLRTGMIHEYLNAVQLQNAGRNSRVIIRTSGTQFWVHCQNWLEAVSAWSLRHIVIVVGRDCKRWTFSVTIEVPRYMYRIQVRHVLLSIGSNAITHLSSSKSSHAAVEYARSDALSQSLRSWALLQNEYRSFSSSLENSFGT